MNLNLTIKAIRKSIFLLMLTVNFSASGQNMDKKAIDIYNKGLKMFQQERYKEADSLFRLSIQLKPNADTYYNLAMTKMVLGDTCAFCEHLYNAANLDDYEARNLFRTKCLITLNVDYENKSHSDSLFYAVFIINPCTKYIAKSEYSIKDLKTEVISNYYVKENDSVFYDEKNFPGVFPDFNKLILDSPIFTVVEDMPQYPGGDEARIKFLMDNIRYPQEAKEKGVQGEVYSTFLIGADGSISDVRILRGLGSGLDEEAVRVIKLMPKWTPGMQSGKAVRVQFNMPIKFTL